MGIKDKHRSHYFQSIARHFIRLRGAPFFLSSKELDLIARWEKTNIPLHVVLEGISKSFEKYRLKPGKKGKILSLAFCDFQVLESFGQYKDRKVGGKKRIAEREEKKAQVRAKVQKFLEDIPREINYLREIYSRVQKMLSLKRINEEKLEQMEERIEGILFEHSMNEEKERVKEEILAEYEFSGEEEFLRIFKLKLVKILREKYKIPYISLFYY